MDIVGWGALKGCRWILTSGAKATSTVYGSPSDWHNPVGFRQRRAERADFHGLRQDFSPPNPVAPTNFECSRLLLALDQTVDDLQITICPGWRIIWLQKGSSNEASSYT